MVKREIRTKFEPLYTGSGGGGNAKLDAVSKKYGFYTMIHNVAELGFFNLPNYTPLRSAELANLHEAYQLLTYRAELGAAKAEK